MKKVKKLILLLAVSVISVFVLAGCSGKGVNDSKEVNKGESGKQLVKIAYPNWVEGIAMTNLGKVILEDKMDYEVEIKQADVGIIFTSLADGDTDFLLDSWLPLYHKNYMEKYKDDLIDLGPNYETATVSIAVPAYMDLNSIEQLADYEKELDKEIIGIEAGASVMDKMDDVIEAYDLDFEAVRAGEPAMIASLKDAIDNKEPIAVLGWTPHWKFSRWDLKMLEDPKNAFGDDEMLHTIARKDIKEDLPEVAELFENFLLSDDEISDLILKLEDSEDKEEAARKWMNEHEELVDSWIPKK